MTHENRQPDPLTLADHRASLPGVLPPGPDYARQRAGLAPVASLQQETVLRFRRSALVGQALAVASYYALQGRLDRRALREALDGVLRRHDSLRTVFPLRLDGTNRVEVLDPADASWPMTEIDLRDVAQAGRRQALDDALAELKSTPFDLANGPMVRGLLARVERERWVCGLVVDHMVFDGPSAGILARELSWRYNELVYGRAAILPPLTFQFPTFARAQRDWLSSPESEPLAQYWLAKIDPETLYPSLRLLGSDQRDQVGVTTSCVSWLDQRLVDRLSRLARLKKVSLFMLTATAILIAVRSHSAKDHLGMLIAEAGRQWQGTAEMIGYFATSLPLWADVPAEAGVLDILNGVRSSTLEIMQLGAPEEFWLDRYLAQASVRKDAQQRVERRFTVPGLYFTINPEDSGCLCLEGLGTRLYEPQPASAQRRNKIFGRPEIHVALESLNGRWRLKVTYVVAAYARTAILSLLERTVRALHDAVTGAASDSHGPGRASRVLQGES
jgi:hypothetical protein